MPFFEPADKIGPKRLELERTRPSPREELKAVNDDRERVDAARGDSLKRILGHNRNEEKEHAAMRLERIHQYDPVHDHVFREHD